MSYSALVYFFVSLSLLCLFFVPRSLFAKEKKGVHTSSLMSTTDFSLHLAADVRDFWWNAEYKKLLIEKFKLREKKAVLDVGCGVGNSTRLLAELTASESSIIGVDVDEAILDVAREKSKEQQNISYQEGGATALPFEDNTFDFIFCQTVMIHLPDPKKAIQEMKRVLKPGGLLIMAETNNRAHLVQSNSAQRSLSFDERLELVTFFNHLERGKIIDGGGDISIAAMLPSFCIEEGFENVEELRNDKIFPLVPPYETPEQKALIAFLKDMAENKYFLFSPEDCEKFFLLSSPDQAEFRKLMAVAQKLNQAYLTQIKAKTLLGSFGAEMLITAGTKKRS